VWRHAGAALGFVPIVICGLDTHVVAAGQGLWVSQPGGDAYELLDQSSSSHAADFWQTNFDRASDTYEIVYNLEFLADHDSVTMVGFGTNPDTWPTMCNATVTNAQGASDASVLDAPIDGIVTVTCNSGYEVAGQSGYVTIWFL
jgi:hypothetical protein